MENNMQNTPKYENDYIKNKYEELYSNANSIVEYNGLKYTIKKIGLVTDPELFVENPVIELEPVEKVYVNGVDILKVNISRYIDKEINEKYEELVSAYQNKSIVFYKDKKYSIGSVGRYYDGIKSDNVSVTLIPDIRLSVKGEDVLDIKWALMAETKLSDDRTRFYLIPNNKEDFDENGFVKIDKDDERFIKYGGTSL